VTFELLSGISVAVDNSEQVAFVKRGGPAISKFKTPVLPDLLKPRKRDVTQLRVFWARQ
jgi:hypothetical protein